VERTAYIYTACLLFCCAFLNACSYSYRDELGAYHVIGLVNIELPATDRDSTFAGQVVDITTVGIALNSDEEGGSFSLGYNREIRGKLRDHALVVGNPLAIRHLTNNKGLTE
jgi:hypothetical protein